VKKQVEAAIIEYRTAIQLKPDYVKAHQHYGNALTRLKRHKEAIEPLIIAIKHNQNSSNLHHQIARSYSALNQFNKARFHYNRALTLRPNSTTLMLDYANMLNMNNKTELALDMYYKILNLAPDNPSLLYNIAYTLKKLNRVDEAMPYYERVLEKRPDHTEAHFSLGLAYLVTGDFERGWREYEWRWKKEEGVPERPFHQPLWDGSDLTGKTILFHAEQGLGDTFQFIRYTQIAKERGAE